MVFEAIKKALYSYISNRKCHHVEKSMNRLSNKRRLLIDVSIISKHDAGTGIQRVVRGLGLQLKNNHPAGWDVITISSDKKNKYQQVFYDFSSCCKNNFKAVQLEFKKGDVFLGLDLCLDAVCRNKSQLLHLKRVGGHIWFFVHDFLPIQNKEWFSDLMVNRFQKWVPAIALLGDGFICNSTHTEVELHKILPKYRTPGSYKSLVVPMGWDLDVASHSKGFTHDFCTILESLSKSITIIMVGTLEPRKGHKDILSAFELLWKGGLNCNLVFVGRPGWKTEQLQESIRSHYENKKHLYWLDNASDEMLKNIYKMCDGVIVGSFAEGYGLPIIEALGYGKPVFARSIQVFELIKDENITFFNANSDSFSLAIQIDQWIRQLGSQPFVQRGKNLSTWANASDLVWAEIS